ncbi:MAG: ThuA domain-containing protein [Candidatus Hydrogenedentes bacterium]|nr:ThuA domain-containing protein [Candidatus Hydrogenedentota bacterium]
MAGGIRVTVWNEGEHEKLNAEIAKLYPKGLGGQIAQYLERQAGIASVHVSELSDEGQGLTDEILARTDVMTWWGHRAHGDVTDENVERVCARVRDGMGLIVLHSGHYAKVFRRLMGTSCQLKWREIGEKERLWVVDPGHPIADGLPEYFELPHVEMYGEHFAVPQPDQLVFVSWFEGGEVFRSGCCWHRERGKVFYFRPGHETLPIYHDEHVLKVIGNAVRWAAPCGVEAVTRGNVEPLEDIGPAA